ncbi:MULTISPECIES: AMP-binding protein [Mycobacterium avium complex (MAC)]|uniref:AMP-binding protein n=3 Tax=Mycobacterium avium complex (MAC) TaxID=120793 RepID=A0AAW5S282_MYCBC|nr:MULTISPECIES: AMP-binding protein [Mycobacterium avium complex (MAC)]ETB10187.1 acyl-CoA synthetase [Mycobacterium avium subsp. silvaticum ATCC 49884]ETB21234.1 acyl-CoA synthetase [Mycobacterium avium subsp. avium 11-4751]ETB29906.1 acyl-CoA synthetase [Mycobacterium avium subsp. hominissuis 10-4249]ANR93411.1 acyl-CoA synthetase [Mycobacterium avium]KDO95943.1 acyl-CoA synthetase [Mycobacterium avium subsp. hominissuis A5]
MVETSISDLLCERASLQPNDTAFTFIDYERDWNGVAETLTWSQLYRRTVNAARALQHCGATGDRAVIMAPQGLDYIVAFLGALHAGQVAVPLALPLGGVSDERVDSVLRDASPTVILTTSSAAETVAGYVKSQSGRPVPSVVEVDLLDLDTQAASGAGGQNRPELAYLQYTSGSTRQPAGVMVSQRNLLANFGQIMSDFCAEYGGVAPPDTTIVSWLPFYHDMGLILGVCAPVLGGIPAVLTSPVSFLQRPARWMQLLAKESHTFSAAPNFAFELAARKTSGEDMAGLDLADVLVILSGSERVHPATLRRFTEKFARFNLPGKAVRPAYGLAEATVYALSRTPAQPPEIAHFDSEKLVTGTAERCESPTGTPLVSYGVPRSPMIRIVDPDTGIECPEGTVGEIWIHGDNVAMGYWKKPQETERTFGGRLAAASSGAPEASWLRTGDSGFLSDRELFIIGRIKDLLIVYGRNHSPDDIEATVQEITRGRCAAIAVPQGGMEKLVVIIEVKNQDPSREAADKLALVEREVTSAISNSHGIGVADLVLVAPGSIPITTSGKVRRASCVEQYRQGQFARLSR